MILRIILLILAIPFIIILTAVFVYAVPFPLHMEDSRDLIAAVLSGVSSMIYLAAISSYIIYSFRRSGRIFNSFMEDAGLKRQGFRYFGSQYKGTRKNREVIVEYFPPRAIQGALLNIYLTGKIKIWAVVSKRAPIVSEKVSRDPLMDLEFGFHLYTGQDDNIGDIFKGRRFSRALGEITCLGRGFHTLQVYFRKDGIYLRSRSADLSACDLEVFLDSLEVMAGILENGLKG